MNRYHSTASKRTRTPVQLLIAAMTAAVIVAVTACSGEQPQSTARPQTDRPKASADLEVRHGSQRPAPLGKPKQLN